MYKAEESLSLFEDKVLPTIMDVPAFLLDYNLGNRALYLPFLKQNHKYLGSAENRCQALLYFPSS